MIKNARLFYRSWKYWHSPMLHGNSMAEVVAHDMYLEVAEEKKYFTIGSWMSRWISGNS